MGRAEKRAMRFLGIKEANKKPVVSISLPPVFKMTWYLESFWEKLTFVLGFFAILYTIGSLLIWGVPWK